jgi:transposase
LAATEAINIGWGGISTVSKSTGLSRNTIRVGIKEIRENPILHLARIRKRGGGRKKQEFHDPSLQADILTYVAPTTRGDPESSLRWTSKSLRKIVKALKTQNPSRKVGISVVRRILREVGYSLQANRKKHEGGHHPDRDKQFHHIARRKDDYKKTKDPHISIDAKKKELIGNFKNIGQEWRPKGQPTEVEVYDFLLKGGIKAVPFGIYDMGENRGFVNVGISADTSVFAGRSVLKWWEVEGRRAYPDAKRLLIIADGGGSNGSRVRLWKVLLQELADRIGIPIEMCHFPPGTSKWNPIEHRLWAPISKNWRGQPLESLEGMQERISHTTTTTGLKVSCQLDVEEYKRGIKISKQRFAKLHIKREEFHGEWNYTVSPRGEKKN